MNEMELQLKTWKMTSSPVSKFGASQRRVASTKETKLATCFSGRKSGICVSDKSNKSFFLRTRTFLPITRRSITGTGQMILCNAIGFFKREISFFIPRDAPTLTSKFRQWIFLKINLITRSDRGGNPLHFTHSLKNLIDFKSPETAAGKWLKVKWPGVAVQAGHFNTQNRDFLKYLKIFQTHRHIEEKILYKFHIFKEF